MTLSIKIKKRMDQLQNWMETNYHINNSKEVYELTKNISKFWSILSEEDKDYIQAAQDAIQNKIEWHA